MSLTLRVPALGESVREATLGAWKRAEGDEVAADEPLVEVESEKATLEVPSPGAGVLRKILRKSRRDRGGRRRDRRDRSDRRRAKAEAPAPAPPSAGVRERRQRRRNGGALRAAPSARKAMAESGLSPADVKGSGRGRAHLQAGRRSHACRRARRRGRPSPRRRRRAAPEPVEAAGGRGPPSTAPANAWCRCRRCGGRWRAAWSRRSRPPPS